MKLIISEIRIVFFLLSLVGFVSTQQSYSDEFSTKDSLRNRYGIFYDYIFSYHFANFKKLPEVPNCCPEFGSGSGNGYALGTLFEIPLNESSLVHLRAYFQSVNTDFLNEESHWFGLIENGQSKAVDGIISHNINLNISDLGISPIYMYRLLTDLYLNAGLFAHLLNYNDFAQYEKLITPEEGTFENYKRIRNQYNGTIKDIVSFRYGILLGLNYDLPLNRNKTLLLSPEIFYYYSLNPLISEYDFNESFLKLGISIKFSPIMREFNTIEENFKKKDEPILKKDTVPIALNKNIKAGTKAWGIDGTGIEDTIVKIKIEEFLSRQLYPLLPYIFFEENSDIIPSRYVRLGRNDTYGFDEQKKFFNSDAMEIYYHLLNIIGSRLTQKSTATITLTGCNSNVRKEKNDLYISEQRANAVKFYLTEIWGIEDNRIKIKNINLPDNNTKGISDIHHEENRRVEIYSDDWDIIKPVFIYDTLRVSNPPKIKFRNAATSTSPISQWNLTASQVINDYTSDEKEKVLFNEKGFGDVDTTIVWDFADRKQVLPNTEEAINYRLWIRDSDSDTAISNSKIGVEQITIQKKKRMRIKDKEIDEYRLIMFDFDTPNILDVHRRILDIICENVEINSEVNIIGYTDLLGNEDYNMNLSEKRAKLLSENIQCSPKSIVFSGAGEKELFDNKVPEGRFYGRTVIVRVETPVEN